MVQAVVAARAGNCTPHGARGPTKNVAGKVALAQPAPSKGPQGLALGRIRKGDRGHSVRARADKKEFKSVEEAVRELDPELAKDEPKSGSTDSMDSMDQGEFGTVKLRRKAKGKIQPRDALNPLSLGRKSRQVFDDVWLRVNQLTGILSSTAPVDEDIDRVLVSGAKCDYETPQAKFTTVLVVGVTGRVGRILVRKLLLRGYTLLCFAGATGDVAMKVRALVRPNQTAEMLAGIPRAVEVVEGDVGDPEVCAAATKGCNKVVYCAGARSSATADMYRVEQQGVYNITKALQTGDLRAGGSGGGGVQDSFNKQAQKRAGQSFKSKKKLFDFKGEQCLEGWQTETSTTVSLGAMAGLQDNFGARNFVDLQLGEKGNAVFSANLYSRGSRGEMVTKIEPNQSRDFPRYDGIVMRLAGDGKPYSVNLVSKVEVDGIDEERTYTARFNTKGGWQTVRIPWSYFIPKIPGDPPVDSSTITQMSIAYYARRIARTATTSLEEESDSNRAKLILHFMKLVPRGEEPDFFLVSCTGNRDKQLSELESEKLLGYKQKGEGILRNSGLGYTIIRPGALIEEPGGQKALVFDQGGRITQGISCADVADVCLRGLHDTTARNKSFDVCYEYIPEEGSLYELIAHLPDKSNNYLTSALSRLDANT